MKNCPCLLGSFTMPEKGEGNICVIANELLHKMYGKRQEMKLKIISTLFYQCLQDSGDSKDAISNISSVRSSNKIKRRGLVSRIRRRQRRTDQDKCLLE